MSLEEAVSRLDKDILIHKAEIDAFRRLSLRIVFTSTLPLLFSLLLFYVETCFIKFCPKYCVINKLIYYTSVCFSCCLYVIEIIDCVNYHYSTCKTFEVLQQKITPYNNFATVYGELFFGFLFQRFEPYEKQPKIQIERKNAETQTDPTFDAQSQTDFETW